MEILIVTGMSGAGKSKVVDALEDLGYFCVDNLPPKLLPTIALLLDKASESYNKVAVVTDIRSGKHFDDISVYLETLKESGFTYKIFFIDANDSVLISRYKETRRSHPLLNENNGSLSKSVAAERFKLSSILSVSDYYLDTTSLAPADCKRRVAEILLESYDAAMHIHCMSFGFKYSLPIDCDLVFDVRCLPNPFYVPELKNHTGLEKPVRDYVMQFEEAEALLCKLKDMFDFLLPLYLKEGKSQLTVAFGCTGGRHRSVCFAENIGSYLKSAGYNVSISHRDINK